MDRVKIGMRAAMMLAVVMIAMFAMPQGAQAQNYKLDGDYVKFMKFVQPDPEEDGKYVDATEAAAGDQILVYIVYDANFPQNRYPTGDFSSNQVTVTKIYDEDGRYKGSGQFTMPARDVTVNAVVAAQEEYTIDLISATSQVIPESVWLLLNGLADNWLIDLNNDSKNDIQLKDVYNESTQVSTYSVIRLAGADYIDSDLSIPLSYVYPLQYNSVLFKLNKKAVQSDWITISGGPFTYTGKAIEPAVTVKDGNTPVAVTVTYSNNKNAGDATVTVTANAQGYTGSASKTFTIAPKAINVAAESKSKKYGEADPALTYTADALIGEDKFSGSLVRVEGENVGTYKIIQGNLSAGDNYNISFTGATLTINPAEVVTTAPTAISGLEYNGGSQVLVNAGSSDHGTVLYSLDGNDYSADLPEGVDAKEYTVYYKFENDANYSTADGGSLQVKIAPKPVTVTTGSATKEYDGTPLTQSEASIEGIVPGERADVIAKGSQTDVGYCTNTYEIVWISANGTNYKVTTENLGTLTVTEKSQQGQGDETVHIPGLPDGAFEREDGLYELEDGSKLEIYTEENGDKNFTNTKENANGTTTVIKIHTDAKGDKFASTTTVTASIISWLTPSGLPSPIR